MGDIGDGIFKLQVSLLKPEALRAEPAQLRIDGCSQVPHMSVPAGNVNESVGIPHEFFLKAAPDFFRGFLQEYYFDHQDNQDNGQGADDGPKQDSIHAEPPICFLLLPFQGFI